MYAHTHALEENSMYSLGVFCPKLADSPATFPYLFTIEVGLGWHQLLSFIIG